VRFFFTEEDHLTRVRGSEIRAALVHAHQDVVHGRLGDAAPVGIDVWLHGMGVHGAPPLEEGIVRALLDSSSRVILFQLCDHETMSFERIPDALTARTHVFLRNHWPKDPNHIPEFVRPRIGWLPPMLKAMAPKAGKPLAERAGGAIFFGTRTGFSNLVSGKNAREETVRHMRASDLPFCGGISPHDEARYHTSPELLVPRMSERAHTRLLADSKVCLAPWGNHPITYRLFEGMALRCLVIAQPLRAVSFLDGGLEPGRHYVEVASDLSDLTEVVRHYLSNLDEAQRIADAGHAHFRRCFASRGRLISEWLFDSTVASWRDIYRPSGEQSLSSVARGLAARLFPRRF
jgi:hypothetical protein